MKIVVFTSSRADFGICLPLLKKIKEDKFFELILIVFGTHLSNTFGKTASEIIESGFDIDYKIETTPDSDSPESITNSMGETIVKFSEIWNSNKFDYVLALGDRYEMFSACVSTIPFNIPIAHIHGGEETRGAIDNIFRHCITLMSKCHFTTTNIYKERVVSILGNDKNVYNVGALSIDNITKLALYDINDFKRKYNIDLAISTILVTFHPETVNIEINKNHINEIVNALKEVNNHQIVITMPNADTNSNIIRDAFNSLAAEVNNVILVESFGSLGYLSCMKHCTMLLGNTSSGFVEASYFSKYVINLGIRQEGRINTPNMITININKTNILNAIASFKKYIPIEYNGIYGIGNTADKIVSIFKSL